MPVLNLFLPLFLTAGVYVLLFFAQLLFREFRSPLRKLAGPKSSSFVLGNVKEMEEDPGITKKWRHQFGHTFQLRSVFNTREIYTADTLALDHIIKNTGVYQKQAIRANLRLVGEGLLGVEGEAHRRQRRIMNPAFGMVQIRALTEVFLRKSVQVSALTFMLYTQKYDGARSYATYGLRQLIQEKPTRIEVLSWLSRMTLDVICEAGFDYQSDSLNPGEKPNEIHDVFHKLLHSPNLARQSTIRLAQSAFPLHILRFFLPASNLNALTNAREKLAAIGKQLLDDTRVAINAAGGPKAVAKSRDLFSLLLRANMSGDIAEDHRMTDSEVIGQIPTFFIAGHATTSSVIAWALHSLSINQDAQTELREELFSLATDTPTLDELNSLTYLDWVVRETLRVHSPVSFVTRIAAVDDILPLGTPCVDSQGRTHTSLLIPKGQTIRIPIVDVNTEVSLWGDDAAQFKPERWERVPAAVEAIPSIWGNVLTFLAGPHNCIGFRFSLAEQKALLFVLIRVFDFERAVPDAEVRRAGVALQSPFVVSEREKGSQMPLMVKAYEA
ncbi:cytochrome P450 [Mycena alexandri]|uniref:Cytochrome P450 n=1 Tax=Mycena alexandri TaxID=1745969 RepID=A0AAD6SDH7_9AGAR|nr:cytochrome P450 [Mycena alexandri]